MRLKNKYREVLDTVVLLALLFYILSNVSCAKTATMTSIEPRHIDSTSMGRIIIDPNAPPTVQLAAKQLEEYMSKILGISLMVDTYIDGSEDVIFFVGSSSFTNRLGIKQEDFSDGSFRILSRENWICLVGNDRRFVPTEPYSKSQYDINGTLKDFATLSGASWGTPFTDLYKSYSPTLDIWEFDNHGSFDAVTQYLRELGVEWYLPGTIGEVLPHINSIPLRESDSLHTPRYVYQEMIHYYNRFNIADSEEILWQLRLSYNRYPEVLGSVANKGHGLEEVLFDLIRPLDSTMFLSLNGRRQMRLGKYGMPCLSSEQLFERNLKYARDYFDIYDEPVISVMPPDGFIYMCDGPECIHKSKPEMGDLGRNSDYVWSYVDRVSRELLKTHPNKKVLCFAYSTYTLPPKDLKKLNPNIIVGICRSMDVFYDLSLDSKYQLIIDAWKELSDSEIILWDYLLHNKPGSTLEHLPVLFPKNIARDCSRNLDQIQGRYVEVYRRNTACDTCVDLSLAFNHMNVYILSRLRWEEDFEKLMNQYYTTFYGPVAIEVRKLFTYIEENYTLFRNDYSKLAEVYQLLDTAREKSNKYGYPYQDRISLLHDFLIPSRLTAKKIKRRSLTDYAVILKNDSRDSFLFDGNLLDVIWKDKYKYFLLYDKDRSNRKRTNFMVARTGNTLILSLLDLNIDGDGYYELSLRTSKGSSFRATFNRSFLNIVEGPSDFFKYKNNRDRESWTAEIVIDLDTIDGELMPTKALPWYFNLGYKSRAGLHNSEGSFTSRHRNALDDESYYSELYFR